LQECKRQKQLAKTNKAGAVADAAAISILAGERAEHRPWRTLGLVGFLGKNVLLTKFPNFSKPQAFPDKANHLDLTSLLDPEFLRNCANSSVYWAFDGFTPKSAASFL
jgi:hypothetical protein